uniref:Echiitoxin a-subunit n=1 Tax=Echiichthys vipera TaxID=94984 RepID=A0A0F6N0C3_9PERO|nr:echiitoxin a-subunit [Echiichthys vipera]
MSSEIMITAALGRPFTLGMLYDARREKLIPGFSLFGDETLKQYTSSEQNPSSEFKIVASDSIKSKSDLMDIEASLGVSFLGGLVEVGGSAKYLNNTKKYKNQSRVTLKYKATTTYQQFKAPPGTVVQQTAVTESGLATHVVTGILYGANAFFVFDSDKSEDSNLQDIEGKMEAVIKKIPTVSIEGFGSVKLTDEEKTLASNLSCKFHGDFILESLPTTFEDAVMTYQKLPEILGSDGYEGVPMKVWLVPLSKFDSKAKQLVREITVGRVRNIHTFLEELHELRRRSNDALDNKIVKQFPLLHDRVSNFQQIFRDYILTIQKKIAVRLPQIRAGTDDENTLENIIAERAKSPFRDQSVKTWLDIIEREIGALKICVDMMEGTQIKVVSNKTELDREVLAPDVKHAVCFVFTSLEPNDYYLKNLSDTLELPDPDSIRETVPSTEKAWCFDTRVIIRMKRKAEEFCENATNTMKDSRNVRFLVAAIRNQKYEGATIYHYKEGSLMTQDYTFSRPPRVGTIKDRSDLLWYACDLTFDPDTAHCCIALSDDNKFAESGKLKKKPDNPLRFELPWQLLCKEGLTGCYYWEVEYTGHICAGVSYIRIPRKGITNIVIGCNQCSWALKHNPKGGPNVVFNQNQKMNLVTVPPLRTQRLGIYLDWRAGTLSYYTVISNSTVEHIYTFHFKFNEPVYPAFGIGKITANGKVRLL